MAFAFRTYFISKMSYLTPRPRWSDTIFPIA